MILAIGLNILEITKIKVANLLPGLIVIAILVSIVGFLNISQWGIGIPTDR